MSPGKFFFFVSYYLDNCVEVFDKAGVYLHDIGCKGSNDGQFNRPCGLVIDKHKHQIVCDGGNQRLQLFTTDGKCLSKFIIEGHYFDKSCPSYVAINNADGNLCDLLVNRRTATWNLFVLYTGHKELRRNPIENRAMSVFSGQKSGTRIILSILQSFLHFLKAKDINICLK